MLKLKTVNKKIQEKYPHLILENGLGYFYFTSDNETLSSVLLKLPSTSVECFRLNHQTIDQWISDADQIMKKVSSVGGY